MLSDLVVRLRSVFRRGVVEKEMDAELRLHLERQTEKYVASGLSREEAARHARIELGGLDQVREQCRDARGTRLLESFVQDVRHGLRLLRNNPGFSFVAILTLALGIGASTAVLSVVNDVLWRPLPFPEPSRIVQISEMHTGLAHLTGATFHDLALSNHGFSETADYRLLPKNLGDSRGGVVPEEIGVAYVSRNFFPLLRTAPLLGRTLSDEEFRANGARAAVLSYQLWQRLFHADPNLVGSIQSIHGRPYLVAGIMPAEFRYPSGAEAWAALQDDEMIEQNRRAHLFTTVGRLRDGVSLGQAQADLQAVATRIAQADPNSDPGLKLVAEPLERSLNAGVRPALLLLFGAVMIVLVIACANVANLQLSRAAVRQKAIAVRCALGASRARLMQQLLTESALMGILGGAAGCLAGSWLVRLALAAYPQALPHFSAPRLNADYLALAVVLALAASLLSGILPALQLSRADLRRHLAEAARSRGSALRQRLRSALIVWEIGLALVLVVSAGLLIKTIVFLARVDPGYQPAGLIVVPISLPGSTYPELSKWQRFVDSAVDGLRSIPGVTSAAATGGMPFWPTASSDFDIEGMHFNPGDEPEAQIVTATPDFFAAMGIRLLEGRGFTTHDVLDAPTAIVINQQMARQIWKNESPIGKHLVLKDWGDPLPGEIVGIVGDAKQDALDAPAQPTVYYSMAQFPQGTLTTYLLIRSTLSAESLATPVREKIWALDSTLPVRPQSFEQVISGSIERRRFTLALLAGFAGLAIVLSVIGVYGLVAYWVEQRSRELGIRIALGAQRSDVLGLVLREGVRLTLSGLAIGALAALGFTRLLAGLLFGVGPADPFTFVAGAALLGGATLAACWLPARRAMRLDPMTALRYD